MKRTGFAFTDVVSGKPVYYYEDFFGRTYMAEAGFTFERVGYNAACD